MRIINKIKIKSIINKSGLTLVELIVSMAIVGVVLSMLVYIVVKMNQENLKSKKLMENMITAKIIGNKIKSAALTRNIHISYDNQNNKYILNAISSDNTKNIEFHLYKTFNTDTFYYVKYNNNRIIKYKIPKYIQFKINEDNNFYEIIYYVYQNDFNNNNGNNKNKVIAFYMLLPK